MTTPSTGPITGLLNAVGRGEAGALERLWTLVYDELHRVAKRQMGDEGPGRTLQTTALVNEAYLSLVGDGDGQWASRRHFFAAAAKAMRRIRVDYARRRRAAKRGGATKRPFGGAQGRLRHEATEGPAVFDQDPAEVLAVDEALKKLEQAEPRMAEVVMLRFFAGLTVDETAAAMELSPRTVDSDWHFARVWLDRELS